jgi:thiamine kinase-like enzyme
MLLEDHAKYHALGPADVGLQATAYLDIARTTSHTGEQFHVQVPVYKEDTREQLKDRVNFFLSIIQDRMEDENKAVNKMNEIRQLQTSIERNAKSFLTQKKALDKRLKKQQLTMEQYNADLDTLKENLKTANQTILEKLDTMGHKMDAVDPSSLVDTEPEDPKQEE